MQRLPFLRIENARFIAAGFKKIAAVHQGRLIIKFKSSPRLHTPALACFLCTASFPYFIWKNHFPYCGNLKISH